AVSASTCRRWCAWERASNETRRHAAAAPPLPHARLRVAARAGARHRRRGRRHLLSPAARVHREGSLAPRRHAAHLAGHASRARRLRRRSRALRSAGAPHPARRRRRARRRLRSARQGDPAPARAGPGRHSAAALGAPLVAARRSRRAAGAPARRGLRRSVGADRDLGAPRRRREVVGLARVGLSLVPAREQLAEVLRTGMYLAAFLAFLGALAALLIARRIS